jgi:hypothetical protein
MDIIMDPKEVVWKGVDWIRLKGRDHLVELSIDGRMIL